MTNLISRIFGKFANFNFPPLLQEFLNGGYVRIFGIDMSEFKHVKEYKSLNELFTRELVKKRQIDTNAKSIISPTDSLITEQGLSQGNIALQIKGMKYSVEELLNGSKSLNNHLSDTKIESMSYINLYLSPKDYHRYHAPLDMSVHEVRYFSGELLPVNMPSLNKNSNLFVRNERVVLCATSKGKKVYFVAVGALNVGKMVLNFEPRVQSNAKNGSVIYTYTTPFNLKKGEEIGMFKMGSTIVLFIEDVRFSTKENQKVKYGDKIGEI